MIRSLRRRHRLATLGVALVLPPAVAVAFAVRAPQPRNAGLDAALREPVLEPGPQRVIELDPRGEPLVPDALVYWMPGADSGESLAQDSVFLGTLSADAPRAFVVPGSDAGRVVVFSLAWQRVVRSVAVAAQDRP
jgi:hypothetical protein